MLSLSGRLECRIGSSRYEERQNFEDLFVKFGNNEKAFYSYMSRLSETQINELFTDVKEVDYIHMDDEEKDIINSYYEINNLIEYMKNFYYTTKEKQELYDKCGEDLINILIDKYRNKLVVNGRMTNLFKYITKQMMIDLFINLK